MIINLHQGLAPDSLQRLQDFMRETAKRDMFFPKEGVSVSPFLTVTQH